MVKYATTKPKLNLRVLKGLKHFEVSPSREISFDGPFDCVMNARISLKNKCASKVAYLMEVSCPDTFMVTPMNGIVEPGSTITIEIMMYPNMADEHISAHYFKMYSVVAMGPLKAAVIKKKWITEQPHNIIQEIWKCKFNEPAGECQRLPLPPPLARRQNSHVERMKQMVRLRLANENLREQVNQLRENNCASNCLRLRDILGPYSDLITNRFGVVVNNRQLFLIRALLLVIGLSLFLVGALAAKYFF